LNTECQKARTPWLKLSNAFSFAKMRWPESFDLAQGKVSLHAVRIRGIAYLKCLFRGDVVIRKA